MGITPAQHELILLYDALDIEPKKLLKYLRERGQEYKYSTLKKYYGYWGIAKAKKQSIMQMSLVKLKGREK